MKKLKYLVTVFSLLASVNIKAVIDDENSRTQTRTPVNGWGDFESLPAEMLFEIVTDLPQKDLTALSCTSKDMLQFIQSQKYHIMLINHDALKYHIRFKKIQAIANNSEQYANKIVNLIKFFVNQKSAHADFSNLVFKRIVCNLPKTHKLNLSIWNKLKTEEERVFFQKLKFLHKPTLIQTSQNDFYQQIMKVENEIPFARSLSINCEKLNSFNDLEKILQEKILDALTLINATPETSEQIGKLIARKLENDNELIYLCLDGLGCKQETYKSIAEGIFKNSYLKILHLINETPNLESWNLIIKSVVTNENIKMLILEGCNIDNNSLATICLLLENSKVEFLSLGDNNITSTGINHFKQSVSTNLKYLELKGNHINAQGVKELCEIIETNYKNLEGLDISDTGMCIDKNTLQTSSIAIDALVKLIESKSIKLKSLNLSHNRILGDDMVKICDALLKNNTINKIYLQKTQEIMMWDLDKIFESLNKHKRLKVLDLSLNKEMDYTNNQKLLSLLTQFVILTPTLTKLKLKDIGLSITTSNQKEFELFIEAFLVHGSLRTLDLRDNDLSPEVFENLKKVQDNFYDKHVLYGVTKKEEEDEE